MTIGSSTRALRRVTRSAVLQASADDVFGYLRGSSPADNTSGLDTERRMYAIVTAHGTTLFTVYALGPRKSQFVVDWLGEAFSIPAVAAEVDRVLDDGLARFGGQTLQVDPTDGLSLESATLVEETVAIPCPANAIWDIAGDRFGLWQWHPRIDNSLSLDDGRHRRDMLQGLDEGGTLEKFLYHDEAERVYIYAKVANDDLDPAWTRTKQRYLFPFAQYHARLKVIDHQGESIAQWTAWLEFDEGIGDDLKAAALAQTRLFYRAGLENLGSMAQNQGS